MIRIFLGKPGGGKSFGALRDILDEAVNGNRVIVTNLSVNPGRFSAYVQKHYPAATFDPLERLVIMTDEETTKFWRRRRRDVLLPKIGKDPESAKVGPEQYGCLYVIDEAHIHFDARAWAETGLELSFYNSQHRKYNDEVIFVTQFLDLLDKRVRGFAAEYCYFVNHGLQRYLTYFRQPAYFTVKVYTKPKTNAPGQDNAQAAHRYQLNKELADCYDTSAGVGIPGRGIPENNRIKGVNMAWIAIPVCLAAIAFYKAPEAAGTAITSYVDRAVPAPVVVGADSGKLNHQVPSGPTPTGRASGPAPQLSSSAVVSAPPQEPVYVRSYAYRGTEAIITLTDGRVLTRATGLAGITKDWVYLRDGSRYQIKRGAGVGPAAGRAGPG